MAELAPGGVEGRVRHAAQVDADRREDPPALSPWINHSWHVTLYATARSLTTSPIWYGTRTFQIDFDFVDHRLVIQDGEGAVRTIALGPRPVADLYRELLATLRELGLEVKIHPTPNELPDANPLDTDREHASYDAEYASRLWRVLVQSDRIFTAFRARFIGKCSPVHFFWGSFDLAVTRFSGRRAPERPGADSITREAYSHEVISAGFWPGGGDIKGAAFYAYAAPEPAGFGQYPVRPPGAFYHPQMKEFILMYDDVRRSDSPQGRLLEFLQSTYDAGADLGKWNRKELEKAA